MSGGKVSGDTGKDIPRLVPSYLFLYFKNLNWWFWHIFIKYIEQLFHATTLDCLNIWSKWIMGRFLSIYHLLSYSMFLWAMLPEVTLSTIPKWWLLCFWWHDVALAMSIIQLSPPSVHFYYLCEIFFLLCDILISPNYSSGVKYPCPPTQHYI